VPHSVCHNAECLYAVCHNAECHYAECHSAGSTIILSVAIQRTKMLCVIALGDIILSKLMLIVFMLSVVILSGIGRV